MRCVPRVSRDFLALRRSIHRPHSRVRLSFGRSTGFHPTLGMLPQVQVCKNLHVYLITRLLFDTQVIRKIGQNN